MFARRACRAAVDAPRCARIVNASPHAATCCMSSVTRDNSVIYRRSAALPAQDAMEAWAVQSPKIRAFQKAMAAGHNPGLGSCGHLDHITKRPADSLLRVLLPFGSDAAFRAAYTNPFGELRVGKLLEELDSFAGRIAYLHCDDGKEDSEPPICVTVSTDRVDLLTYPLMADRDVLLTGMVSYAGQSSMTIDIDLAGVDPAAAAAAAASSAAEPRAAVPLMQASFTFVARDASNKAVRVPKLAPASDWEHRMYEAGRQASEDRKAARKQSLFKQPPSLSELAMVHDLFVEQQAMQARPAPKPSTAAAPATAHSAAAAAAAAAAAGAAAAAATPAPAPSSSIAAAPAPLPTPCPSRVLLTGQGKQVTTMLTMPQEKNIHGRVFGGFLMRSAFELAWVTGWQATGVPPRFLALDDTVFLHPVEVGTVLTLEAWIDHALGAGSKTYSVMVTARMRNPSAAAAGASASPVPDPGTVTNTFSFTFYCADPSRTPRLYPRSYEDAMRYIEAARRAEYGTRLAEARKAGGVRLRFE